jgi:hypothetical protein
VILDFSTLQPYDDEDSVMEGVQGAQADEHDDTSTK